MTWTDKHGRPELIPGDDVNALTAADSMSTVVYSEEHTYRRRPDAPPGGLTVKPGTSEVVRPDGDAGLACEHAADKL